MQPGFAASFLSGRLSLALHPHGAAAPLCGHSPVVFFFFILFNLDVGIRPPSSFSLSSIDFFFCSFGPSLSQEGYNASAGTPSDCESLFQGSMLLDEPLDPSPFEFFLLAEPFESPETTS